MSIEEWPKSVASGNHSRFLFPDKQEGPDLMFVLGRDDDRILCVLQVCGQANLIDFANNGKFQSGKDQHQGAKIEEAVESLVKGLRKGLYDDFKHAIIFIDVVTSANKPISQSKFLETVDTLLGHDYNPRNNIDYFTYIDGQTSASVWGETFHKLIRLMKGIE